MASIAVPCPKCKARIKVRAETVGKGVRCPKCSEEFEVPPQAIPAAPVCPSCHKSLPPEAKICVECGFDLRTGKKLQTEIETKKKPPNKDGLGQAVRRKRPPWLDVVNWGLGCHYVGVLVFMLGLVAFWLATALLIVGGLFPVDMIFGVLARIFLIASVGLSLVASLIEAPNNLLGLWVPDTHCRGYLIASLLSRSLLFAGGFWLIVAKDVRLSGVPILVFMIVGWVLWLLFLRRLSLILGKPEIARYVALLIGKTFLTIVGAIAVWFVLISIIAFAFSIKTIVFRLMWAMFWITILTGSILQMIRSGNEELMWKALLFPTGIPFALHYLDIIGTVRTYLKTAKIVRITNTMEPGEPPGLSHRG